MSDTQFARLRSLFDSALEVPPIEREAWVAARTADDATLRTELLDLLREEAAQGGPLSRGPASQFARWDPAALVGRELGGYRIERLLARGGMGVVYVARQRVPDRLVALKTLASPEVSEDAQRRFLLEVELLGRLQHRGIAQVYDGGAFDVDGARVPYLAMELVRDARDLVTYARERALDERARVELLRAVCEAVHEGHRRGIVHRDLKPANVLVDGDGNVKVIDFGLARVLDADALGVSSVRTLEGRILGTLDYMSPEHVTGSPDDVDVRSDVYSLGCVVLETLTGRAPRALRGLTLAQAVSRIEREPVTVPRDLPRPLRAIAAMCLAPRADDRYPSVAALEADLRRYRDGEPVGAMRARPLLAVSAFSRRHKAMLFGSFGISAALAVGLALAEREARRANAATDDARREAVTALEVSDFLATMTSAVNAYHRGRDAKIADLLESGVRDVEGVTDERARAVVESVIGQGFLNLGELERARPLIESGTAALAGLVPATGLSRIRAEAARADLLEQVGEYDASLALTERLLPLAAAETGPASQLSRYLRTNRAVCLGRVGRHAEAEAVYAEQLALVEAHGLDLPRVVADTHQKIASMRIARGDLPAARESLLLAQSILRENGLGDTLDVTNNRMSLASIELREGRPEEALAEFDAALAEFKARRGSDSNVLSAALNKAQCLLSLRRVEEARAALDEARALAGKVEPRPGRYAHFIALTRARADYFADDFEAARAAAEEGLRIGAELVPTGHPDELRARILLALADAGLGDVDRAVDDLRAGEPLMERLHGPNSDELLTLRRHAVTHLVEAGRRDDADALARATVELLGADAPDEQRARWRTTLEEAGARLAGAPGEASGGR